MFTPGKQATPISKEGVSKPAMTMEKPGMGKGMEKPGGMDHKAALAKMHPEHLHKMVMAAHSGKYGPEAQQAAQQAMQPQGGMGGEQMPPQDGQQQPPAGGKFAGMFDGRDDQAPAAPVGPPPSKGRMFSGMGGE